MRVPPIDCRGSRRGSLFSCYFGALLVFIYVNGRKLVFKLDLISFIHFIFIGLAVVLGLLLLIPVFDELICTVYTEFKKYFDNR